MGYWENTTYLAHPDASAVALAIEVLFAEEGMRRLAQPAERQRDRYEPMQYAKALQNNLWGLAVFPGADGWTVVKTAPLELLGERARDRNRMRLVDLASRLGAAAVQINVFDSTNIVLVETDGRGGFLLSGYRPGTRDNPDPLDFNGEPLLEERAAEVRFELLPLQAHVDASHRGSDFIDNQALAHSLAEALGSSSRSWCDNIVSVDYLICHKPLPMADGVSLYFAWPPRDRPEEQLRREHEQLVARLAARR
jgi:hypothetical protein